MITGTLSQDSVCDFLSRNVALQQALQWIRRLPSDAATGVTEIHGKSMYANVHGYSTRLREACTWESHRRTCDVQYCLDGGELIDWSDSVPERSVAYDESSDFETWPERAPISETIRLRPGRFVVFLPGELHRPCLSDGNCSAIRKVVVKISADRLVTP